MHVCEDIWPQGLAQGIQMVQELLVERLRDFEIHRIQPMGEAFDPHFHEALQEEERDDVAPGTVVSELMPGYRMADQLLRAAKVLHWTGPYKPWLSNGLHRSWWEPYALRCALRSTEGTEQESLTSTVQRSTGP